jgi:hypothetical protein
LGLSKAWSFFPVMGQIIDYQREKNKLNFEECYN